MLETSLMGLMMLDLVFPDQPSVFSQGRSCLGESWWRKLLWRQEVQGGWGWCDRTKERKMLATSLMGSKMLDLVCWPFNESWWGRLLEKPRSPRRKTARQTRLEDFLEEHSCKRRKNQHRPIFPPKKLAPKNTQKIHKNTQNSTVFRVLFPKISTGQKK